MDQGHSRQLSFTSVLTTESMNAMLGTGATTSSQAAQETVNRNQKVFKRYAISFAHINEPQKFMEDATKFTKWLENPKGYYDTARPKILKLAMIMQGALRRATGVPEALSNPFPLEAHVHHPMSQCYVALVRTIYRFRHLFVEPDLQVLLRKLFDSANLPEDVPQAGAAQSPPIASTSPWTTGPPQQGVIHSQHNPNVAAQFTEPVPPNMHPPQVIPSGPSQSAPPQPHAHMQGQSTGSTFGNIASTNGAAYISLQDAFSIPGKFDPPGPPVTPSTATAETSPAKQKKKKRRKASLDISKYEDLDVQTFLAKKEQLHSPTIPPRPAPSISGVLTISAQPEAEPETVASASNEVIVLDTPSPQATPVAVKPEPQETAIPRSQSFTPGQHEVIDLTLSEDEVEHMAIDQAPVHPLLEGSSAPMDVDEPAPLATEPGPQDEPPIDAQDSLSEIAGPDQQNKATVEPIAGGQGDEDGEEEMELGSESSRQATKEASMDLDTEPAATPVPSTPTAEFFTPNTTIEAGAEAVEALSNHTPRGDELSAETIGESHESEVQDHSSMNVEQAQQEPVPATLTLLTEAIHESKLEEAAGMTVEQEPHEPVPTPLSQMTQSGIYGNEIQVMAFERGKANKSRLAFGVNVDEEQYKSIMKWTQQKASIPELKRSLCISLACYPVTQIDPTRPLELQLMLLTSSWPEEGGLTLKVEFNANMETFSLSPPLFISPDSTVDLSMFVKPGLNQFFINQYKNWSDHVFVLIRHRPTEGQIEDVEKKRRQEEEWQSWLKEMAKPIQVDLPPLQTAVAVN